MKRFGRSGTEKNEERKIEETMDCNNSINLARIIIEIYFIPLTKISHRLLKSL